jgi:hypothetical protein
LTPSTARWNAGRTQEKGTAVSDNTPQNSPDVPPAPPTPPTPSPSPDASGSYPGYAAPPADSAYQPPAYASAPAYDQAPPAYPQQSAPYGYGAQPYPYAAAPKTNALAITSLIASIANFVIVPFIGAIVGVITGHIALKQLRTSGEGGRGMAVAGVIVGWVGLAGAILVTAIFVIAIVAGINAASTYDYSYS